MNTQMDIDPGVQTNSTDTADSPIYRFTPGPDSPIYPPRGKIHRFTFPASQKQGSPMHPPRGQEAPRSSTTITRYEKIRKSYKTIRKIHRFTFPASQRQGSPMHPPRGQEAPRSSTTITRYEKIRKSYKTITKRLQKYYEHLRKLRKI